MPESTSGPTESGTDPKRSVQEMGDAIKRRGQDITADTREKVQRAAVERKEQAASYLRDVADAVHSFKDKLDQQGHNQTAHYAEVAANQLRRVGEDLTGRDIGQMLREAERFAREKPAIFLGALFLAGFGAARFLRSSAASGEAQQGSFEATDI